MSPRRASLIALGLAVLATLPLYQFPTRFADTYDWRYFETWIEAARRSVLWFNQFPLWNPWTCGGQVYLANPQSLVTAPTFVFPVLFGTALGLKLMVTAYFFCAFDGMFRLARSYGLSTTGAWLASVLLGAGGWLALHIAEGHNTFLGAALFPYMMLCYRKAAAVAEPRWEFVLPLGALAAWVVAQGGTSTPPMAVILLVTLALTDGIGKWSLRPFGVLAAAAIAAALLGAIRILPALEFALVHPRHLFETDSNPLWQLARFAYEWRGVEPVAGKRYYWHEYGFRLSYLTPPLILWGLRVRRALPFWILAAVGAGIVAGAAWPYGPWWLMHNVPIFRDLRVPSRYTILLALALPLVCGAALDDLLERFGAAHLRLAATLLVVACALDGMAFDWVRFHHLFQAPFELASSDTPFHQVRGEWRSMMHNVFANRGAIGCDEEAPLQRALTLDEGAGQPQVRLDGPGELRAARWTPNRIEADVALPQPATIVVNENWNEHWRASAGQVVRWGPKWKVDHDGGRLAVAAPAGTYTLAIYYRPTSFVVGALTSALAWPLAIVLWIRRRRRAPA